MCSNITKFTQISDDFKKQIQEVFNLMDCDKDGYLDRHEMKAAFRALGIIVKKSFVVSSIRIYDKINNNKISYNDFYFLALEKLKYFSPLDEAKTVFNYFVNNSSNNMINLEDLKCFNEKLDCNLTHEEMEAMIREFDINADGFSKIYCLKKTINEAEFLSLILGKMSFGIDWNAEHRQTLLESNAVLERGSQSLQRSQAIASETEQIGTEVINELGGQRERLLNAKHRLSETDQELDRTRRILNTMRIRIIGNLTKIITYC
ncbi:uncharacterized protein [Prorops nasuta]|uniref:uncharacterized protein n=1 Tax=Prorops nasuta TaxID=863751 RepID=UPI0034CFD95C